MHKNIPEMDYIKKGTCRVKRKKEEEKKKSIIKVKNKPGDQTVWSQTCLKAFITYLQSQDYFCTMLCKILQ